LGGGLGSLITRYAKNRRFTLGVIQFLTVMASTGVIFIVVPYTVLENYTSLLYSYGGNESFSNMAVFEVCAALVLVFLPAFLMGMTFPMAASLSWRPVSRFSGFVGDIQLILTLGGVAGALFMSHCLIPDANFIRIPFADGMWFTDILNNLYASLISFKIWVGNITNINGLMLCLLFVVTINWIVGFILTGVEIFKVSWLKRGIFVLAAAGGIILLFSLPSTLRFWKESPEGENLIFYASDKIGEVAVVERSDGYVLKVNNTSGLGGTDGEFMETRLGMLPYLLSGGAEKTLVMGLGTGNTLFGLLAAGAKDVDCVELIGGVVEASRRCFYEFEPTTIVGGRLRIIFGDARIYLRKERDKFDLILGDLYFPWQSEAGFMYTKEHFSRIKDHLTDDGVFFQWVPLHQLRWENFNIIGNTFIEVFPHVHLFLAAPNVAFPVIGLLGSNKKFTINPTALEETIKNHSQAALLEKNELNDIYEILSLYVGDDMLFKRPDSETDVNTEDRTVVEFRAARAFENSYVMAYNNFQKLASPDLIEDAGPILEFPEDMEVKEWRKVREKVRKYSESLKSLLDCHSLLLREDYLKLFRIQEDKRVVRKLRDKMGVDAIEAFKYAPDYRLAKANLIRLWNIFMKESELAAANNLMAYAIQSDPEDDSLYNKLGMGKLLTEDFIDAAACFEKAIEKNEKNFSALAHLAVSHYIIGDRVKARDEMGRLVDKVGYKNLSVLSKFIEALAILILEGSDKAAPHLKGLLQNDMWRGIVEAALKSASESGVDTRMIEKKRED